LVPNTSLLLAGFVAGLWVDWLLRKLDGSRTKQRETLGVEMRLLSHDLDLARPQLESCFIAAGKLGIWAPDRHIFTLHIDFAAPLVLNN
jgi:uncharacterized membrane-anchored protein YhcB (DUF1043 family)